MPREPSDSSETRTIPLHEEIAEVGKRTVEHRAQIDKRVSERRETIETMVRHEVPSIDRVAINRVVAEPPPVRQEGDTLVIPVLEEVAVIERRLILREEVRVRRRQVVEPVRHDVALRSEDVVVTPSSEQKTMSPSQIAQRKDD